MFHRILAEAGDTWTTWDCEHEEPPADLLEQDAVIITGSAADAHGQEPWLSRLKQTIVEVHRAGIKILGICFGHQIVAWALGGESGRNPKGWELAMHPIRFTQEAGGFAPGDEMYVLDFHQDHVTRLPPGATCLASSPHTPVHIYRVGTRVLCLQSHPEFEKDMTAHLVEGYAESRGFTETQVSEALASLQTDHKNSKARAFIKAFLRDQSTTL